MRDAVLEKVVAAGQRMVPGERFVGSLADGNRDQFGRRLSGPLRVEAVIAVQQLDGPALNAAGGIGFFDGQLHAIAPGQAEAGAGAGDIDYHPQTNGRRSAGLLLAGGQQQGGADYQQPVQACPGGHRHTGHCGYPSGRSRLGARAAKWGRPRRPACSRGRSGLSRRWAARACRPVTAAVPR